jgi:predicted protein tyrosine phosphatase
MLVTDPAARRLTICGLGELCSYQASAVSHVLSILDPGFPDPEDFAAYGPHHRLTLRFHDIIVPVPGQMPPASGHVERLIAFGREIAGDPLDHLLVHCHAGISRSTAAMGILLAEAHPERDEDDIFAEILGIRPQAWPNSVMIGLADDLLGRDGRLLLALRRLYGEQIRRRPELAEMIRRVGREREAEMAL